MNKNFDYDWINNRVYFHDTDDKFFTINYIPSNPIELQDLINNENLTCDSTFDYPEHMIRAIKSFVYEELNIDLSREDEIKLNNNESN